MNQNRVRGNFTDTIDLAAGEGVRISFGMYSLRQGDTNREVRISLDDGQDAATTPTKSYVVFLEQAGQKNFKYLNDNNGETNVTTVANNSTGDGFNNPAADDYLGTTAQPTQSTHDLIRVVLTILPGGDNTTVINPASGSGNFATTGALLSVDWDGDGVLDAADGDVVNADIGPRCDGVASLSSFELFYGFSSSTARGAYFDDFLVQKLVLIPEPATLALMGMGGLAMFGGRRRRTR